MCLNLKFIHKMSVKHNLLALMSLGIPMHIYAQETNIDTPNLSFENGNFENWKLSLGGIYAEVNGSDTTYHYDDWNVVNTTNQIRLVNGSVDSNDPTVSCWDFKTNPDGIMPVRIGDCGTQANSNAEKHSGGVGQRKDAAMAERLEYRFKITENTSLLTYRYAAVLHCPDLLKQTTTQTSVHTCGSQLPTFSMSVKVYDADGKEKRILPCGEIVVNAEGDNADNLLLVKDLPGNCARSVAGNKVTEYAYCPWTYGNFDLSDPNLLGCEVVIQLDVHDCLKVNLVNGEPVGELGPGNHKAYAYFWAETKKLELKVKDCIGEDARIMAPKGFSYEWKRSDDKPVEVDPEDPSVAIVPNEEKDPNVKIICTMTDEMRKGCAKINLETQLKKMGATLDFDYENDCGGMVTFKDVKCDIVGDRVDKVSWDFGEENEEILNPGEDPKARFMTYGKHDVTMSIHTANGCTQNFSKPINVRYFPTLSIDSKSEVCFGDSVDLRAIGAASGSTYEWSNGATTPAIRVKVDGYKKYTVTAKDEFSCGYDATFEIFVKESPSVAILGDEEVCLNDTATLLASVYSKPDEVATYAWSVGAMTPQVKVSPLKDETEYRVTVTNKEGCSTTVSKVIKVNQLPEVSVSGDVVICKGEASNLVADAKSYNGEVTYIWGDVFDGKERTVYPDETTTYSVHCVDAKKCKSRPQEIKVKVTPLPDIKITGDSVICEGASTKLTVTGVGTNVTWYDGTEGQTTITRVPTQDTVYWVKGISNNCESRAEYSVKLLDVPNVWIEGKDVICQGDTTELVARGADSYVWSSSEQSERIKVNPYTESEYSVIGTSKNGGCTGTGSIIVRVNEPPVIELSGDKEVCDGAEAKIMASGASQYYWSNNAFGPKVSVRVTADDTLTVRCVDDNQCEAYATWTIKKKDLPVLTYEGDTAVCSGHILTITASGAHTYEWQDGSGTSVFSKVLENDMELKVKGYVNGCSSSLIIPVSVLPVPALWVSGSGVTGVCAGDSASLIGHGADSYRWSNGLTSDTIAIYPNNSTNYTLYGYSAKGCEVMVEVPVKVNPNPMVFTKGDNKACRESIISIEAADANGETASFSWSNGILGSTITPQIIQDQVFTVTAENQYGCKSTATHEVFLTEPPVLSFEGNTQVCYGEKTTLKGNGALNYTWTDGVKEYNGSSIEIKPENNTLIRMTGSNVANCPATIDIDIVVLSLPTISISGDTAVCKGDAFNLYASGAKTYKWNTNDETDHISYTMGSTTEFKVTGTNEQGCVSSASKIVSVRPAPLINIEKGHQTGCPGLPDTIHLTAKGAELYKWSSEPYSASVEMNGYTSDLAATIEGPTLVTVEGKDAFGCTGYAKIEVDLIPRHEIEFSVSPDFIEEGSSNVRFSGVFPKNAKWYWETGDNSRDLTGVNTSHFYQPNDADSFLVKVRAVDQYGCEYTGRAPIYTWIDFWAPEGFTPNGDDKNDTFKFYGGDYMDSFKYIIYNRLGEIVFEGQAITDEWDGILDGAPCPQGVYGWYCEYESHYMGIEKKGERKGFISLIR